MAERYSRRRITDRKDGRRLRTISPVFQLTPFLMLRPEDALHSFTDTAEVTAAEQWVHARRGEGYEDITLLHIFVAAYVRTLAHRPAMNRFVSGRYLYARDDIEIVFTAGRSGQADEGALAIKVLFQPTDTVFDVCRKINARLNSVRADKNSVRVEKLAYTLVKTPRFVLRGAIGVIRWLDHNGWLSLSVTGKSPFHGTAVFSDEGASSLPPMTRSINSLGCLPLSLSIGRRRNAIELDKAGLAVQRRYADYAVSFDSRIADNNYIGSAFKYFRYYIANPEELEKAPERVNEDAL